MAGKFKIVNSAEVDLTKGLVILSLECGHLLRQKRSPSYLKKPQFITLETSQGRPLKAHCNICKKKPGAESMHETLDDIVSTLTETLVQFDGVLEDMAHMFKDANNIESIDICDNKVVLVNTRGLIKTSISNLERINKM